MNARRRFIDSVGRLGLSGAMAPLVAACGSLRPSRSPTVGEHYDLVVIGTGFGGTMTALTVAYTMEGKRAGKPPLRILMLERGTWWTTPMETVQDKKVSARDFLIWKGQPTQEWSSLNDYRGMMDLVRRCRYSERRPQGLFDFAPIGKRGLFGTENDGVSVLRASGVGGGSLIYSKILIRPPETLFDDPRWPGAWRGSSGAPLRTQYYKKALAAVTQGIEVAFTGKPVDALTGPSNILTRSAGSFPAAVRVNDSTLPGQPNLLRIRLREDGKPEGTERELIDRARVFQSAISKLTPHFGTVDLSINDMEPGANGKPNSLKPQGTNVCERHGRCNVGCLPGAGQTLNKQIQRAMYGLTKGFDIANPKEGPCVLKNVALELKALAEVDHISESAEGYQIHYRQRNIDDPVASVDSRVISADRVVVAAGSLGSSEIMLRSRQRSVDSKGEQGLRGLSDMLGFGFSPNGDHIAFLAETAERVNLNMGPVTTSFGQFKSNAPQATGFHNVEDQGIPRSLSALTGYGSKVMQRLANDDGAERYVHAISEALTAARQIFGISPPRVYPARSPSDMSTDRPEAEDELTATMMCVVAQGKDAADGQFWLEGGRLRVKKQGGKEFHKDPIYESISHTLERLAEQLRPANSQARFISPLLDATVPGAKPVVLTSHPLGGCLMGQTVADGVVDEWGRVFRKPPPPEVTRDKGASKKVEPTYCRGLYVADGSVVPTALGVNPSLTISAVALRVADKILAEWDEIPVKGRRIPLPLQCLVA